MNNKKTVIITGANRGIGFSIAKKFAKNNFNLILCTRADFKNECLKFEEEKFGGSRTFPKEVIESFHNMLKQHNGSDITWDQ